MEISPRQSLTLDFDGSSSPSSYSSTYLNCGTEAYESLSTNSMVQPKVPGRYAMTGSTLMDSGSKKMLVPKKENFISHVFNALTSGVMERLAKIPNSFIANMNNTLSVTVVPNEGIISQEFFKTLTQSCEQLATDRLIDDKEIAKNPFFDPKSQISRTFADNSITEKSSSKTTLDHREIEKKIIDNIVEKQLDFRLTPSESRKIHAQILRSSATTPKVSSHEIVSTDETDRSTIDFTKSNMGPSKSRTSTPEKIESPTCNVSTNNACTNGWQTLWSKVHQVTSDRSSPRVSSPDPEIPPKKPNLASNSHPKARRKTCIVARGRGKGRGKSQLRRSGVSQSSLRKERTKQNIYFDIQDDFEAFEDFEFRESEHDDSLRNICKNVKKLETGDEDSNDCLYKNFTFDEITRTRRNESGINDSTVDCSNNVEFGSKLRMKIHSGDVVGIDEHDCATRIAHVRPRLVSESSVDSEDSYCIVFENNSDSDYTDYTYDTDTDEDLDDEDLDDDGKTTMRVRFNLEPQVHKMIQWNFAYRAARRGPWEEMARDRERFRGRIRGVERTLESVLSPEHRKCVFHERFDVDG